MLTRLLYCNISTPDEWYPDLSEARNIGDPEYLAYTEPLKISRFDSIRAPGIIHY